MENNNKKIDRRSFLKVAGAGTAATTALLVGCKPNNQVSAEGGKLGEVPTDKMTYRVNPNTGEKVSLLGYGCMRFPMIKNAEGKDEVDQETVNELVDYAIAHGINYFDTAPVYLQGESEKAVGIALSRHPRDKFLIATKLSNMQNHPAIRSKEGSIAMYRKSFEDLQVDHFDYYLLHNVGRSIEDFNDRFINNGMLDFLLEEREAGRIRNLGWSFHGFKEVFDYILNLGVKWDFVQIMLNYKDWQNAIKISVNSEYLYNELAKRNIPVTIMEPILGGRLSKVPPEALNVMKSIHPDDTAAKWAFRFSGSPENVLCVLSGMVYMEHLQENLRTFSPHQPLNKQEYEALEKVTDILLNSGIIQCTACQYCMPCPYGINIPDTFSHFNNIVNDGHRLKSSADENYKKARRAFLIGYDRAVPKLRQATYCIGCGECLSKCPQRLNIPEELQRIESYTEQLKQGMDF